MILLILSRTNWHVAWLLHPLNRTETTSLCFPITSSLNLLRKQYFFLIFFKPSLFSKYVSPLLFIMQKGQVPFIVKIQFFFCYEYLYITHTQGDTETKRVTNDKKHNNKHFFLYPSLFLCDNITILFPLSLCTLFSENDQRKKMEHNIRNNNNLFHTKSISNLVATILH